MVNYVAVEPLAESFDVLDSSVLLQLYTARTRHIPRRTKDVEANNYPILSCILFFKPRQNFDFATKTWREEDPDRSASVRMYLPTTTVEFPKRHFPCFLLSST